MPPLVPASTYWMRGSASPCARRTSSWKFEFPPSMMMSPADSSDVSALIVDSVGSPAGTISQTARGEESADTTAASDATPWAPAAAARATASGLRSNATTAWPPRARRVTMLRPIRPRPTKPSCIATPEVRLEPDPTYEGALRAKTRQQCVRELPDERAIRRRAVRVQVAAARGVEQREVVALADEREQRVRALSVQRLSRGAGQRQRNSTGQHAVCRAGGQLMARFIAVENPPRRVLGLLHIRLVERIDVQERASHGCRDFPAHEFSAKRGRFREIDLYDRRT